MLKLLLLSLGLAGVGAGWYGLAPRAEAREACAIECPLDDCPLPGCHMTVERIDPDTCRVTCRDESGAIVCQREIACDQTCDKACTKPCDAMAKTCSAGTSCAR